MPSDSPTSPECEKCVLATLLASDGEQAGITLAALAHACPGSLHEYFVAEKSHQYVALGLQASLRNECKPSIEGIASYLSTLHHHAANDIIAGRPTKPAKVPIAEESAFTAIGGWPTLTGFLTHLGAISRHDRAIFDTLRNLRDRRVAIDELRAAAVKIKQPDGRSGPAEILAGLAQKLGGLARGGGTDLDSGEALHRALIEGDRRREAGDSTDLIWGLPCLDQSIPLRRGSLVVIAAAPGGGKTSLALTATGATADASPVAFASLEMQATELAAIIAGHKLQVARAAILGEIPMAPGRREQVEELAAMWRAAGKLTIAEGVAGAGMSADQLCAWARHRKIIGGSLGLLVVDYLQLLKSTDARATEYQTISHATRALKLLALELNCCIIALSQLRREGRSAVRDRKTGEVQATTEPTCSDLRGSGSIEQDADAVILLHKQEDESQCTKKITAIIAKNRRGPLSRHDLIFNGLRQQFSEQPPTPPRPPMPAKISEEEDHFL